MAENEITSNETELSENNIVTDTDAESAPEEPFDLEFPPEPEDVSEPIYDVEAEAGVISTLMVHPEFYFHSEDLTGRHFYNVENGHLYFAIGEMAKRDIHKIDSYGIFNILNLRQVTKAWADKMTVSSVNEMISIAPVVARNSVSEYKTLAKKVLDTAFRREAIKKLKECETICRKEFDADDIKTRVYKEVESLVSRYQQTSDVTPLSEIVDKLWEEITRGQQDDSFVDFKFPTLNRYLKISRTDAIVIAAREKRGKSLFLLNCAIDLVRRGKRVLVIDTELDTKLYFMRLISHLSGVEFSKIRDGTMDDAESALAANAREWLKKQPLTHVYRPAIDDDQLVSLTKQYKYKYGLDALILDYLKGNTSYFLDAYQNSAVLGKTMDTLKNYIAGELGLYVLTAVQATRTGSIADSQKIIRNCSALLYLERKSQEQIEADGGLEYGNMTLNVRANRNGEIQAEDDYISLTLDGNRCMFTESKQPEKKEPY